MTTYYIDPTATTNGNGLSTSTPYNTWVGITLTANNTYLQKRGTNYNGATVRPQNQSSSVATPLTIAAYYNSDGSDDTSKPRPVINHNGGTNGVGAVFIDTCSNVVVQNIDGCNSRGSLGGGVKVRRSTYVLIDNCIGRDSEHGITIQQEQAAATSTCTNITISNCITYNNVGAGICLRWGGTAGVDTNPIATATLKRIKIIACKVYNNGTGKGIGANAASIPCGGIMVYPFSRSNATYQDNSLNDEYRLKDILVMNNLVYNNNGYGINFEMVDNEYYVSTFSGNEVSYNGKSLDVDSHSLWVGTCFGVIVNNNFVHNNYAVANGSTGSGVGIFIDYNTAGSSGGIGCKVIGNRVENQYRGVSQAVSPSAGIMVLSNQDTIVEGNVVINCRQGVAIGPAGTDNTRIRNNTFINIIENGVANNTSGTTNTIVQNNVFWNASTGIFSATSGTAGFAESYNIFYNCTNNVTNGTITAQTATTQDASDQILDPTLYMNKNGTLKQVSNNPFTTSGIRLTANLMNGRVNASNLIVGAYQVGRV